MQLTDLIERGAPQPWVEGDNIPWNDPAFSRRMLKEHLTQDHDAATRRLVTVDRHVKFINEQVLTRPAARILDLGCGPGLYSHRLARLGHSVRGIDFSPASVEYARHVAESEGLDCAYTLNDVRAEPFGQQEYDLVMFIFGEFNVFCPADARLILEKAHAALRPGGQLLLETSTASSLHEIGIRPPGWYTVENGLFSDRPHLMLEESFWNEEARVAINRYMVVDAATAAVTRYSSSYQAYSEAQLSGLLHENGFGLIRIYPSLTGEEEGSDFFAVVAEVVS